MINSCTFTIKVLLPTLLLFFMNAPAAQSAPKKFGAWVYNCNKIKNKTSCTLSHSQIFKDKSHALTLALVGPSSKQPWRIYFRVPLGAYLPDGLSLQIDARKERTGTYADCNKNGCLGNIEFNGKQIWALKAGKELRVKYTYRKGKKTIALQVPLKGITAGINEGWPANKFTKKKTAIKKAATRKEADKKTGSVKSEVVEVLRPKARPEKTAANRTKPVRSGPFTIEPAKPAKPRVVEVLRPKVQQADTELAKTEPANNIAEPMPLETETYAAESNGIEIDKSETDEIETVEAETKEKEENKSWFKLPDWLKANEDQQ